MISDDYNYLGQLFGPKSENEDTVVKLFTTVLLDYTYWRKNYFPDDQLALPSDVRRQFESETDKLMEATSAMVAKLRRSFPFYSPRYIAHQQSETTVASLVGAMAGTLYNSNNVTPESGNATVEMEIDACDAIIQMLGFKASPPLPTTVEEVDGYLGRLGDNFGWCHLTSGGTVANIEALWVARAIKYFPLAVRDVCNDKGLALEVALPRSEPKTFTATGLDGRKVEEKRTVTKDIRTIKDDDKLLGLRPMEVLTMLGKLSDLIDRDRGPNDGEPLSELVWTYLDKSPYSPRNGIMSACALRKPVIFVSGAAHYSIKKAADILGIGKNNVRPIAVDENFRIDVNALKAAMEESRAKKGRDRECILAVVAIAGTTEEGAVDPLHEIVELKRYWERQYNESFWIHVDAAWGGFMRSIFIDPTKAPKGLSRSHFIQRLTDLHKNFMAPRKRYSRQGLNPPRISPAVDPQAWFSSFVAMIGRVASQHGVLDKVKIPSAEKIALNFRRAERHADYRNVLAGLQSLVERLYNETGDAAWQIGESYFEPGRNEDIVADVRRDCSMGFRVEPAKRSITLQWPDESVGLAFLDFEKVDSVTIDPHKMGYTVYPNGAVAFRSDLVRHFIRHEAPYITAWRPSDTPELAAAGGAPKHREKLPPHHPLRHASAEGEKVIVKTEAFAQYTLEGSRPSAAATSLWLSMKTLPFNRAGHGRLVRASVLAARHLHQLMSVWKKHRNIPHFSFLPFASLPPDTNILIFGVKQDQSSKLEHFNNLNNIIYRNFSILLELGERAHSYSQPFFLSKTDFQYKSYPYVSLKPFFERNGLDVDERTYRENGVVVLRATVMNPYILPMKEQGNDLIADFMADIEGAAMKVLPRPGEYHSI